MIKKWLGLFKNEDTADDFKVILDSEGLNLVLDSPESLQACIASDAPVFTLVQYAYLKMLEEQGEARQIPNGFVLPPESAVCLSEEAYELFKLPLPWQGKFETRIAGLTTDSSFSLQIIPILPDGTKIFSYNVKGPCLYISDSEFFLLNAPQYCALEAVRIHNELPRVLKSEHENLNLIYTLQDARQRGMDIDISHFNKFNLAKPDKVGVAAIEKDKGSLELVPVFHGTTVCNPDDISKRISAYIHPGAEKGAVRVKDSIILLDKRRMEAVHEILTVKTIPKTRVRQFLETPSAFLNASLVELDTGFSVRVKGATTFRHAYFGETDKTGIDWFGRGYKNDLPLSPAQLNKIIKSEDDIQQFQKIFDDAIGHNASEAVFGKTLVDISDPELVKISLKNIKDNLHQGLSDEASEETSDSGDKRKNVKKVLDVALNDERLDVVSSALTVDEAITNVSFKGELSWANFKREPFPHQDQAVRWILGLALEISGNNLKGGLLADDMGLGKTFVALAAAYHFFSLAGNQKQEANIVTTDRPVLVVAPLSLLLNWKKEVDLTFEEPPFDDVIILQSAADLSKFKVKGRGPETNSKGEIRYALKVGPEFGHERLDMPRRIILTTYQTLRDYQFSISKIDWSFAIFDEAQNIKNPNALQTRAAKGIKAQFILLATGTPVENSLVDFWCLMDTAVPGLLGSYQGFRDKYIVPINRASEDEVETIKMEIGKMLRKDVSLFMLRRVKEDHIEGLPGKNIFVGLQEIEEWQYHSLLDNTMQGTQLAVYEEIIRATDNENNNAVLAALHRLRDVSLHPSLVEGGIPKHSSDNKALKSTLIESSKIEGLLCVLDEIKKRQEKVIIFLVNKRLQRFLSVALAKLYNLKLIHVINGDAKAVAKRKGVLTRHTMIEDFEEQNGFNIIIMSPIAAGVGLTVTGANNVVHLERHWNPAKEAQATDRVYRIGQTKDVNIFIPILKHPEFESFDVNLHRLLWRKSTLKDAVVTVEQVVPQPAFIGSGKENAVIAADGLASLSWKEFEALVAELYAAELQAKNVWLTPESNDYGADVVLLGKEKNVLVQCKFTGKSTLHSQTAVRELITAPGFYGKGLDCEFSELLVVTNAKKVSRNTRKIAEYYKNNTHSIKFITYEEISILLKKNPVRRNDLFKRLNKERLHLPV